MFLHFYSIYDARIFSVILYILLLGSSQISIAFEYLNLIEKRVHYVTQHPFLGRILLWSRIIISK